MPAGEVLLDGTGVVLLLELLGNPGVGCGQALLVRRAWRFVKAGRMHFAGLDDLRPRHPLIAVVRLALVIDPAIHVRLCDSERTGEDQGADGQASQHKGASGLASMTAPTVATLELRHTRPRAATALLTPYKTTPHPAMAGVTGIWTRPPG